MKENYFNIPNFLTILRILFSPVFFVLFIIGNDLLALIIFIAVALTDVVDGWVARTTNQKTRFGKFIDPMADKFMIFLALAALILRYGFPLWAIPLILSRDIISLCGSLLIHLKKRGVWKANKFGKLTTLLQIVVIVAYVLDFYKIVFLWIAIVFSLITAVSYVHRGINILMKD